LIFVPVSVSGVVDADRKGAAVKVIFNGCPAVTCKLAGETVTPDGSPVIAIPTLEANPLRAVTETVTVAEPLAGTVTLESDKDRLKLGMGGVGWLLPPPQPESTETAISRSAYGAKKRKKHLQRPMAILLTSTTVT